MDSVFDPRFHNPWNEALIKETKIRMKWMEDYNEELEKKISDDQQEYSDFPSPKESDSRDFDWPRTGAIGTATIMRYADTPSQMRKPTPFVKARLYRGISHDGKGRAGYLKKRCEEDPEDKFHSPVCTSWDYGWDFESAKEQCNDSLSCNIRERAFWNPYNHCSEKSKRN